MVDHAAMLSIVTCGVLAGCSAGTSTPSQALTEARPASRGLATADSGARIYNGNCIACHQQDARGIPGVYPSLVGSPVVLGDPSVLALWVVKGRRPSSMPAGRYPTTMMQFGWMSAQDAAALLTYLRGSHGNEAPPVEASLVALALDTAP
jgi:mono/diheme cytochrome c family protein